MTTDRHDLELNGYNALLADHCELNDRVAAIEALLQRLRLPELVAEIEALGCLVTIRIEKQRPAEEIIVDLGHGWQIIRAGTSADGE